MFTRSRVARVVALLMVPLVFLGVTARPALAATTASVAWSASADVSPEIGFGSTGSCTGLARYSGSAVDGVSVEGSVRCAIANEAETDPESLENGGVQVTITGARTDGSGCAFAASSSGDPLAGVAYETNVVGEGCQASEICVAAFGTWNRPVLSDVAYNIDACSSLTLGPLPEDVGGCQFGTPMGVFEDPKWVPFPSLPDSHGRWEVHVKVPIMSMTEVDGWGVSMLSGSDQWVADIGNVTDAIPWGSGGVEVVFTYSGWAANGSVPKPKFMTSVEVYHDLENWQSDHASHAGYQSSSGWQIPGGAEPMPPGRDRPFMGSTQPLQCRFYFGPKLFNAEGTEADEPAGEVSGTEAEIPPVDDGEPVEIPPPPPPPPGSEQCAGFSLTDPSTWAGAAMCAVAKLLGSIWESIKDLLAAVRNLVSGILDGLEALFVPQDPDWFKKATQEMRHDFDGRFPFSVSESMNGLAGAAGGGGPGGCPDWWVKVGEWQWKAVCDSSYTAAIRGARGFILAGMLALAFWPLIRGVFYASVPVIKPTPVGGK